MLQLEGDAEGAAEVLAHIQSVVAESAVDSNGVRHRSCVCCVCLCAAFVSRSLSATQLVCSQPRSSSAHSHVARLSVSAFMFVSAFVFVCVRVCVCVYALFGSSSWVGRSRRCLLSTL
jgi:hypothetical protein